MLVRGGQAVLPLDGTLLEEGTMSPQHVLDTCSRHVLFHESEPPTSRSILARSSYSSMSDSSPAYLRASLKAASHFTPSVTFRRRSMCRRARDDATYSTLSRSCFSSAG